MQVSEEAVKKRYNQGWLQEYTSSLDEVITKIKQYRAEGQVTSIGYHGNVVKLWYCILYPKSKNCNDCVSKRCDMHSEQWLYQEYEGSVLMEGSGADPGGPRGPGPPDHQN